jgi:hypothetical protein
VISASPAIASAISRTSRKTNRKLRLTCSTKLNQIITSPAEHIPKRIASRQETYDAILRQEGFYNAKVWRDSIISYTPLGQIKRETLTPAIY